jgi:hypothetical protein
MPIEILEKTIALAMPERITVTGRYTNTNAHDLRLPIVWVQCYPFQWTIWWCAVLLRVSKSIRRIVRKHLAAMPLIGVTSNPAQFAGFKLRSIDGVELATAPDECEQMMRDYFTVLFTRDEEQGLPPRRRAAKVEATS